MDVKIGTLIEVSTINIAPSLLGIYLFYFFFKGLLINVENKYLISSIYSAVGALSGTWYSFYYNNIDVVGPDTPIFALIPVLLVMLIYWFILVVSYITFKKNKFKIPIMIIILLFIIIIGSVLQTQEYSNKKELENKTTQVKTFSTHEDAKGMTEKSMTLELINNAELNFNQTSINGLAKAYGFILGQEFSLERISKEYPNLSPSVTLAKAQFDSSFPGMKSKLKDQLIRAMGEKLFDKTDIDLKKQLQASLGGQVITSDIAQGILQQVKQRADGNIDSPILEYMLSVKYLSNPVGEFFEGYRQRFSTDGHRKSQGINLILQVPKSWKAKEGERPHIVQKWVSQDGTGLEIIFLDIRDSEGYTPTNSDVESFVSSGEVKDMVPSGAAYINSGLFSLEMLKGYWIEMGIIEERAGIKLYQHSIAHQLFFRGKAIGLMCQASNSIEDKIKADEAFERIKPICQQVLNSLVLLQAY
jgi:hypothetical protein